MNSKRLPYRIISILAVCLMMTALFSGCKGSSTTNSSSGNSSKQITVIFPASEIDNVGFFQKQTDAFTKSTGIKVELIDMAWDSIASKVTTEMSSGGSSYDVIEFDASWVSNFVTNKWVIPLDSYKTAEMKSGLNKGLDEIFSYKGKTYGIAWNNDTRFFMYNKKMLDAAGISVVPRTWDELIADTKILQSKNICKYGFIDSYAQGATFTNEITSVIYSFGGDVIKDGVPTITTDPAVKAAFAFLQKGLTDKIIDPASMTSSQQDAGNAFCQGDAAFFPQAWAGLYEQSNDPSNSKVVGQIAIAPYSVDATENINVVMALPEAFAIPTSCKNKDLAWKYIAYMSSKDFDKQKALTIGALPIYDSTFTDSDVLAKYPYWVNFGKQSLFAKGLAAVSWHNQFSDAVSTESQKLLLNQVSIDQGLKDLQVQATQISKSN